MSHNRLPQKLPPGITLCYGGKGDEMSSTDAVAVASGGPAGEVFESAGEVALHKKKNKGNEVA